MPLIDDGLEILTDDECHALLRVGTLGRVATTVGALPVVLPVNYAVLDGSIVFLTGEGLKLRAALERVVVAFEVDEIDTVHREGWSVLAVGVAAEITGEEELSRARELNIEPLVPGRTRFVSIRPDLISGRRISRADPRTNGAAAHEESIPIWSPPAS